MAVRGQVLERANQDPARRLILRPDDINRNGQDTFYELGAAAYTEYFDLRHKWVCRCQIEQSRYLRGRSVAFNSSSLTSSDLHHRSSRGNR
jgi:hypothetical protein